MFRLRHVPLAWLNLVHDKRRFVVCVAGVSCAVLLLFMEFGFFFALLNSQAQLIQRLDADVVLVSKARYCLALPERFAIAQLEQARAVPDVATVAPLYLDSAGMLWHDWQGAPERIEKRDSEPSARPIRVIAFNPDDPALHDPQVTAQLDRLRRPGNVLLDNRFAKRGHGEIARELDREVGGQRIHVVGTFELGADFTCDGSLIMSDRSYADLMARRGFAEPALRRVDLGLIRVRPGVSPAQVRDALNQILPNDVQAKTVAQLAWDEKVFWMMSTPIGPVFGIGLVMGFCVGAVICFQILSTEIADHLKEYATLKAIGYPARALDRIVLAEALWLTILGYVPALLLAKVLYVALAGATGLPMYLGLALGVAVFLVTAGMCMVSGFLAMTKLRAADPAEVF